MREKLGKLTGQLKRPEGLISLAGCAALLTVFVSWWLNNEGWTPLNRVGAILSLVLFTAVCLRFVPRWLSFWRAPDPTCETGEEPRWALLRASGLFLASLIVHFALAASTRLLAGMDTHVLDTLRLTSGLDTEHYLSIARHWYTVPENGEYLNLVFFPGYPVLVGVLMMFIRSEMLCGMIAAWAPYVLAGAALYRLLRLDFSHKKTMRILWLVCLFPAAVFFSYPMSESLFLLLAVLCLYGVRTQRWLAAGVCGAAAAFTRSVGALLLAPMAVELVAQIMADPERRAHVRTWLRRGACLLIVPVGLLLYLYINFTITGDPLIFMQYQKSNWYQSFSWFFATAGTQMDYAVDALANEKDAFWGLWVANLAVGFGSLGLMIFGAKRLRPSLTAWFIVHFAVSYGASWLLSGPRYMVVFFPLAIVLEQTTRRKWIAPTALGVCAALYTIAFALRWSVW